MKELFSLNMLKSIVCMTEALNSRVNQPVYLLVSNSSLVQYRFGTGNLTLHQLNSNFCIPVFLFYENKGVGWGLGCRRYKDIEKVFAVSLKYTRLNTA